MRIKGEIHGEEELTIEGEVEGSVELGHRLIVGGQAKVTASVKANEVVVQGSIRGNVEAADKVVIRSGARIVGDVKTAGIIIEDGAYFKGAIDIVRPEAAKAASTSRSPEVEGPPVTGAVAATSY